LKHGLIDIKKLEIFRMKKDKGEKGRLQRQRIWTSLL